MSLVPLSDPDRKRLWGKAANRCAMCNKPLTRADATRDPEVVIGDEAHVVGERPGSARHRAMYADRRDGYENRILLCPNDHRLIDRQPHEWTEGRLLALKHRHEVLMRERTAHGERSGLVFESPPSNTRMEWMISGKQVLDTITGALAYQFTNEALETDAERTAASDLLQAARDWGEIWDDVGPAGHIDAEAQLGESLNSAMEAGLLLCGTCYDTTVRVGEFRERWPIAYLHLRRLEPMRQEARAAASAAA